MKALVIGQTGQLACKLLPSMAARGHDVRSLARTDLDLSRPSQIRPKLKNMDDVEIVIIAAAYTAVDQAESDEVEAFAVNAEAVREIGLFACDRGVPVIHISTDYVFDGELPSGAYRPGDAVGPKSVYGASKLAGEKALRDVQPKSVILRTAWVYSDVGRNFLTTMLRLGREHDQLRIVADQFGSPTSALDLAQAVVGVAERIVDGPPSEKVWGVFHCCGGGDASWYDFAAEIFKHAGDLSGSPALTPVSSGEYPTAARRPKNSRLDCSSLEAVFGLRLPAWKVSLQSTLDEMRSAVRQEVS